MLRSTTIKNIKFAFVVFATFVSIRLWSFQGIPKRVYDGLELVVIFVLAGIVLINLKKIDFFQGSFKKNVILFILLPLVSSIAAFLFHEQSILLSLLVLRTCFFWLLYFVIHVYGIPINRIRYLMLFIGVVWIFLTIIQQYTYPHFLFYTRSGEEFEDFYRLGVYRFMLVPHEYGLFVVLYFFNQYLLSKRILNLFLVLIGLTGFYYFVTRQFAVAAIVCLSIAAIFQNGKIRYYAIFIIIVVASIFVLYEISLFSGYTEMTKAQIASGNDIRLQSAKFYLFEYWPHWFSLLTGNGLEHLAGPSYGKEMGHIMNNKGFFRADVGIIGAFNTFGIFYVINILHMNVKGLRKRFYTLDTSYLKLIFANSLLLILISQYYSEASSIPFYCFILYLVDKSYQKKMSTAI
jgi:hypothetical protein